MEIIKTKIDLKNIRYQRDLPAFPPDGNTVAYNGSSRASVSKKTSRPSPPLVFSRYKRQERPDWHSGS